MPEKYKDEDWLREQYVDKDKSTNKIAEKTDITHASVSRWLHKFGIRTGERDRYKYICPDCNLPYKNPSTHFTTSHCERPEISRVQKEMLKGLVMGDGSINHRTRNWAIRWVSINEEFMDWFDWRMGDIGIEVRECKESFEEKRESFKKSFDWDEDYINTLNFHKTYRWSSITHPSIKKFFNKWIKNSEKVFPNNFEISPISTCIWYCGDGGLNYNGKYCSSATITTVNESSNIDNIVESFNKEGLYPKIYKDKRNDKRGEHVHTSIVFSGEEMENFFEYIGEAPPGMEYKWETEDRSKYDNLMKNSKTKAERRVKESIFDY